MIYWAWSNILSLTQQSYIMKKQGAEIHLIGNLSRQFKPLVSASTARGMPAPTPVKRAAKRSKAAKTRRPRPSRKRKDTH